MGWKFSEYTEPAVIDGVPMLKVTVPEPDAARMNAAFRTMNLNPLRNKILMITFEVKAESVTKPAHSYNGVKVMFYLKTKTGEVWRNPVHLHGSFDWREIRTGIEIPPHAEKAQLIVGLQECSGTLLVRRIRIEAFSKTEVYPSIPVPANFRRNIPGVSRKCLRSAA